ncbi:MAG: TIR domain-containing protein [Candidatus Aminicenantes bacterium]|jgi:hypothetical protein
MKKIFISYSHKDEGWKDRVNKHLRVFHLEGSWRTWDDRQIPVGAAWEKEITDAIQSAHTAILLITVDFLTSDFIMKKEVPLILERWKKAEIIVFPVIVKPCSWKAVKWLKEMQVFPNDGIPLSKGKMVKREENLSLLAEKLNGILQGTAAADETQGSAQQPFYHTSFGETKQPKIELLEKELANKNLLIKKMTAMNEVKTIGNAVESYITDNYKAPQAKTMEELKKQLEPFYITELPLKDPWGKPYQYRQSDTDESEYTITCTGSENKIVFANGNFLDSSEKGKGKYSY